MTDLTREEVDAKLAASEAKVDARLANFDTSVKAGFADMRASFADLRASFADLRTDMATQTSEMRTQMAEMRTEMHKNTVDLIKWGVGVGLAFVAVTISVLTFVVKTSLDKPAAPPATQSSERAATGPAAVPAPLPPK